MPRQFLPNLRLPAATLVTVVLYVGPAALGYWARLNVGLGVALMVAALVALDLWARPLRDVDTAFSTGPLMAALMTLALWPVVLPWYLHAQALHAQRGTGVPREPVRRARAWRITGSVLVASALVYLAPLALIRQSDSFKRLAAFNADASTIARTTINMNWSSRGNLTLTIQNPPDTSTTVLSSTARRIAYLASTRFLGASMPDTIIVVAARVERRGPVTTSLEFAKHRWIGGVLSRDSLAAELP